MRFGLLAISLVISQLESWVAAERGRAVNLVVAPGRLFPDHLMRLLAFDNRLTPPTRFPETHATTGLPALTRPISFSRV